MASQLVLEALETLHKELDKMKPAIRQIEIAERVIEEVKKIPEHYFKVVNQLENQESQFKKGLVNDQKEYTDQLRKEIGTLISSVNSMIVNLKNHEEQLGITRKELEPLVNELNSLKLIPKLVKIQDTLEANASTIKQQVEQLIDSVKDVEISLGDKISDLDKGLRQRVDALTEKLDDKTEQLQEDSTQILIQVEQVRHQLDLVRGEQKTQKTFTYITWTLIIAIAILIKVLK